MIALRINGPMAICHSGCCRCSTQMPSDTIPKLLYGLLLTVHTINLLERTSLGPLDTLCPDLPRYIVLGSLHSSGVSWSWWFTGSGVWNPSSLSSKLKKTLQHYLSSRACRKFRSMLELPLSSHHVWLLSLPVLISLPFPVSPENTSSVGLPWRNPYLRFCFGESQTKTYANSECWNYTCKFLCNLYWNNNHISNAQVISRSIWDRPPEIISNTIFYDATYLSWGSIALDKPIAREDWLSSSQKEVCVSKEKNQEASTDVKLDHSRIRAEEMRP